MYLDKMPFIVLSANASSDVEQECLAAGASAYLSKPIDMRALLDTIEKLAIDEHSPSQGDVTHRQDSVLDQAVVNALIALNSDPTFLQGLVDVLEHDAGVLIDELEAAVASGDEGKCGDISHALKGASASVAAVELASLAAQAGRLVGVDTEEVLRDLRQSLSMSVEQWHEQIRQQRELTT